MNEEQFNILTAKYNNLKLEFAKQTEEISEALRVIGYEEGELVENVHRILGHYQKELANLREGSKHLVAYAQELQSKIPSEVALGIGLKYLLAATTESSPS